MLREDKNWELLQNVLSAEASGREPRLFSSRRTLFGIPSSLDAELAQIAAESAAKCKDVLKRTSEGSSVAGDKVKAARPSVVGSANHDLPQIKNSPMGKELHRVEHNIDPVFDEHSRVLILGTMPSPKSREVGFYYAHPQNRFWPVLARVFDEPVPATTEQRRDFALAHGIALWDVLASCAIAGAADATIAECVSNDIAWLCSQTGVRAVFCTGNKAFELYNRYCADQIEIPALKLPSPSAANAAASLDELTTEYSMILSYLA